MTPSQEACEYPLTDDEFDRLQAEYDLCGVDGRLRDFAEAVIEHDRKARQQEALDARRALSAIRGHWREFGPEHGFDECLEMNTRMLDATP